MEWTKKDDFMFMLREFWILILNILHVVVFCVEILLSIAIPVLILVVIFIA